jgi:heat shock protein HtpX
MKRIFLFFATNLAVLALLCLLVFVCERFSGIRLGGGGLRGLLAVAGACGIGGSLVSLALSKWSAKRVMGVRVIAEPQSDMELWLHGTVRRLAAAVGIGMPEVGIFDAEEMNAFATGARRNAALVAVSSGLLRSMPRAQAEAVLAHEISHIANGDMVTLTLLQGVLNTFVIFVARLIGSAVDRNLFKNDRGESGIGFFLATMVAQLLLGLLASMIVSWYSRQREFRADRGGANLTGVGSMVGALEVLKRSQGDPLPAQMQIFGINSANDANYRRLFMSHPSLEARIAALLRTEP